VNTCSLTHTSHHRGQWWLLQCYYKRCLLYFYRLQGLSIPKKPRHVAGKGSLLLLLVFDKDDHSLGGGQNVADAPSSMHKCPQLWTLIIESTSSSITTFFLFLSLHSLFLPDSLTLQIASKRFNSFFGNTLVSIVLYNHLYSSPSRQRYS